MNIDRLMRMAINMLMRRGVKHLTKGKPADPRTKQAQQAVRSVNRIRRM